MQTVQAISDAQRNTRVRSRQRKHRSPTEKRKKIAANEPYQAMQHYEVLERKITDLERAVEAAHGTIKRVENQLESLIGPDTSLCPDIISGGDPSWASDLGDSEAGCSNYSSDPAQQLENSVSSTVTLLGTPSPDYMGWLSSRPAFQYDEYLGDQVLGGDHGP
jgi:hypothetical protein